MNNQKVKRKQKRERTKHDSDDTLGWFHHIHIQKYRKAGIFIFYETKAQQLHSPCSVLFFLFLYSLPFVLSAPFSIMCILTQKLRWIRIKKLLHIIKKWKRIFCNSTLAHLQTHQQHHMFCIKKKTCIGN